MGNRVQAVTKSAVVAYDNQTTNKQKREVADLKAKIKSSGVNVNSVAFEGGGAKVMAYVGAAQVCLIYFNI